MSRPQETDVIQQTAPEQAREINLSQLMGTIRTRIWILVLFLILGAALGGAYAMKPEQTLYAASTRIVIQGMPDQLSTLKAMLREPKVLEHAAATLNLDRSASGLKEQISLNSVDNSLITVVTVRDPDPVLAVELANGIVESYKREVAAILDFNGVDVLTQADASTTYPVESGNGLFVLLLGLVVGGVAGIGLIFFLDTLDDKLRSEQDIEKELGLPVLGSVSRIKGKAQPADKKEPAVKTAMRGESIGS